MALVLALAFASGQARLLRGLGQQQQQQLLPAAPAARELLSADGTAAASADNWGSRDWPATRQVATSSGRGFAAAAPAGGAAFASSRAYGYQSNAPAFYGGMGGGMSAPIYDSWSSRG